MGSVTPKQDVGLEENGGLLKACKDYARWRPSYHLIAPRGWMNDPCAPGYNPSTGTYHIGFQWNPHGAEWGDIIWGKAFSRDLVSWDVSEKPSLTRDAPYDSEGVFTGCWRATGLDGQHDREAGQGLGEVSFIYTSVSRLPIHYTKDYHRGCETLSLACSKDGGHTWTKASGNPILAGPPEGTQVTGWRDPYVAHWPSMSKVVASRKAAERQDGLADGPVDGLANVPEPLYGIISGGIRSQTPTTFLYEINPNDLTKWTYAGPVVTPGLNFSPSRWTGDLGVNWEVTNFMTLTDGGQDGKQKTTQDFLILGAEGCRAPHGGAGTGPGSTRSNRSQLWIGLEPKEGIGSGEPEEALMKMSHGGIFDHGLYYAANGFWDPSTQQQVVIGWVTEEDVPVMMQVKQTWSGCLSLPRVVSLATIPHVVRAIRTELRDLTNTKIMAEGGGSGASQQQQGQQQQQQQQQQGQGQEQGQEEARGPWTVQTLRIVPERRLEKLRAGAVRREAQAGPIAGQGPRLTLATAHWEAYAEISGASAGGRVGLVIRHGGTGPASTTRLYLAADEETLVVERADLHVPMSYTGGQVETKLQDERAPLTLFTVLRDGQTGQEVEERLRIRVFYDSSVVEVYVNERAVITTRLYLEDARCSALEVFADRAGAVLEQAVVWDGLSAGV